MSDPTQNLMSLPTVELIAELGRRYRLRYGRLEIPFHDGRPSPRVLVEHRTLRPTEEHEPSPPTRTEGGTP